MTSSISADEQERLNRLINSFATQSFRDQADRDYIAARLAWKAELFPQFLWSSQQAIEKYLKAILLYNRIKAPKVGHDIAAAMALTTNLTFVIELSLRSKDFIKHIADCGEYRYIDIPYDFVGYLLVDLDLTVWELRRYCQVLDVFGMILRPEEETLLSQIQEELSRSSDKPRYKFRLHGGFLEKILDDRKHPSRSALLWQNAAYGVRKRPTVRVKHHFHAQSPMLYLYPEILDELQKFVCIPGKLAKGYRDHFASIQANQDTKP
ncbi:MAG: HEPN domain-containing protein [Nitrosomonadaceae bacterium]|nr:HEPN domain-containing protein [Nitrosomonadaceae bacterium]